MSSYGKQARMAEIDSREVVRTTVLVRMEMFFAWVMFDKV